MLRSPVLLLPQMKMMPAPSPDAYVDGMDGWRRKIVRALRSTVRAEPTLEEVVKWGHLVFWRMDRLPTKVE